MLAPTVEITRVADVTGLDSVGIPVVMVCAPNSRSVAVSQGKGDLASARASGLMEAAELYHAESITLPLRLGSYGVMVSRGFLCTLGDEPDISTTHYASHAMRQHDFITRHFYSVRRKGLDGFGKHGKKLDLHIT